MPGYFFDKLVGLVGDEFDMEFKSMKEMYEQEQGDPVERLREMAQEEREVNPNSILSSAGRTRRLLEGRMYMFKYMPKMANKLPYFDMFPVGLVMNG